MAWIDKYQALKTQLTAYGSVVVAYSGGVDSVLLAFTAKEALGDKSIAVLGVSQTYPQEEIAKAKATAEQLGLKLTSLTTHELSNPNFSENTPDRCYHCKSELFSKIREYADAHGFAVILDGSNADDLHDFRPGMKAARELGVHSPFQDVGMTKSDIRATAKHLGLPVWNKPSYACLSSRFPYGTTITAELIAKVGRAEAILNQMGFKQVRARHHGSILRIEFAETDIMKASGMASEINQTLKGLGYTYIAMDMEGYRSGKMNDALKDK